MLTDEQLHDVMPHLAAAKAALLLPHLNAAMAAYGVNTERRTAAFIDKVAHESGEFRWMEEIWGPTDAQRRYEPPSDLAQKLGNVQAGDGKRFKGRGPIQITGRFNYKKYGDLLGTDLLGDPDRAATPEVAFAVAGLYWKTNGLNELADADDFVKITRRINGGTNGLADRQRFYALAKEVLALSGFSAEAPVTRGRAAPSTLVPRDLDRVAPLTRGAEALRPAPKKRAAPATAAPAGSAPARPARGRPPAASKAAAAPRA